MSLATLSSFPEIPENIVIFATGNFRNVKKRKRPRASMIGYCCLDGLLYRDSALVNASYYLGGRGKKDICREVECDKSLLHHLK